MPINTSAATSHWGLRVCKLMQFLAGHSPSSGHPSLPSNALEPSPGAGARALPLVSPPWPKARWKVREVSSLLTASFQPKLNQFPPHHVKYGPGTWGCVANPLKISLSAASVKQASRIWGVFSFCHVFGEFWRQISLKVPRQVCFHTVGRRNLSSASPAQPGHSPLHKLCSESSARWEFLTADTTPVTHKDTAFFWPLSSGWSNSAFLRVILQKAGGVCVDKHVYTAPVAWDKLMSRAVLSLACSKWTRVTVP